MSRFTIEKAVRRGKKARIALAAPAGGGKTYTALTIAGALADGGPILVIDTERGSASLYADQFDFQTIRWEPPYDPRELAKLLAEVAGQFAVVVIDSLSHFWMGEGGTLDIVDAAGARARGNTYAGWKEGTPAQTEMVDAMLNSPAHVIVTMRSKTEYVLENRQGKNVPVKVGMAPVQRDGIEYEFTVTCDLDIDHRLMVGKTRCILLAGKTYTAGHAEEMGHTLREWLDEAAVDLRTARADDFDRIALATRIEALDEEYRAVAGIRWRAANLPPRNHPDLTKDHVETAESMLTQLEAEAESTYDRRRKHVNAKMNEVGVKSDDARHELMRHATEGRTESSKRLTQGDVDAIVAYCSALNEERAAS